MEDVNNDEGEGDVEPGNPHGTRRPIPIVNALNTIPKKGKVSLVGDLKVDVCKSPFLRFLANIGHLISRLRASPIFCKIQTQKYMHFSCPVFQNLTFLDG